MPLAGLPAPAAGSVVLSSMFSILVSTAGLALLRGTRPSEVRGRPVYFYLYRILGVFGALLLYVGHVLASVPMLMGVSTDDEGKAAALVQCTLVGVAWAAERYLLLGKPLPPLQSCVCAVVWFGATLIEWAGPRPYDNMSLGLPGQIAGCDGGYRSPFLIYAAVWLTVITFGTLLLCWEDTSGGDVSDSEGPAKPSSEGNAFRRKVLPVIYGFAISMSGLTFATGAASDQMGWIAFGSLLLVVAVFCAWDWLWRLELTLGAWAPASLAFSTILRVAQGHLFFRDFRWDPDTEQGLLIVWKWPGLQLFLLGFLLVFVMVMLFLTCDDLWVDDGSEEHLPRADSMETDLLVDRGCRPSSWIAWLLFPICVVLLLLGITMPLIVTEMVAPDVEWVHTGATYNATEPGSGHHSSGGKSYMDLITFLYDRRLPCSALVVAYNSTIMPPIQFAFTLMLLLRPKIIPERLNVFMRTQLENQAPFRFANPMVLMLSISLLNLSSPDKQRFSASFGNGFWFFAAYCFVTVFLAFALEMDAETNPEASSAREGSYAHPEATKGVFAEAIENGKGHKHKRTRGIQSYQEFDKSDSDEEDEEEAGNCLEDLSHQWQIVVPVGMGVVIVTAVAMYLAITRPFLVFDFRLSGIVFKEIAPTVSDLWHSLRETSHFLSSWSAATLVIVMIFWIPILALSLLLSSAELENMLGVTCVRFLERFTRPWVMGHIWAVAILVLYYIVTARNKAVIEVCAHFPESPAGLLAVAVMGGGVLCLQSLARVGSQPHGGDPSSQSTPKLPGGPVVWVAGPIITVVFWVLLLYFHGPQADKEISGLSDLNRVLSHVVPPANDRLRQRIPESAGNCQALWIHEMQASGHHGPLLAAPQSEIHQHCAGNHPLAHVTKRGPLGETMAVSAEWATGLNSVTIMDARIVPPANVSGEAQDWNITLSGLFTDLRVFMKVMVGDNLWIYDYMCCNNPFHFTVEASAVCRRDSGFNRVELHVLHLDPIEFVHNVNYQSDAGDSTSMEVNYGSFTVVEEALKSFMTGKTGHLLIANSDGTTTDPMEKLSDILGEVLHLNTGHHCVLEY